ncbi:MAG: hypothetical protein IJO48_05155 [Clostridia bacterium]|nr:hypothetical protein [Clostridia bacterium]
MEIKRFALGLRFKKNAEQQNERTVKNIFEHIFKAVTLSELKGLSLWGGNDPYSDNVYVAVIMGGSLKKMRRIYKNIISDESLLNCLEKDMPIIENNRIAHIEDPVSFGTVGENDSFIVFAE